jgi:DNA-binding NarL/FixJ family response regulator
LLDINVLDGKVAKGNGIDFCAEVTRDYPEVKVLMITSYADYAVVLLAMDSGASGYVIKNNGSKVIIDGIQAVMQGETFYSKEIRELIEKLGKRDKDDPDSKDLKPGEFIRLNTRDRQLLERILKGMTNPEIADDLCLGLETVKTFRKFLKAKLKLNGQEIPVVSMKR